jgi:Mg2+/Co2+ transporter CorC
VPAEGEVVELEGIALTVERLQGRRVASVLVRTTTDGGSNAES